MNYSLFAVFCFWLGIGFGWLWAHDVVSTECERQGSFYVGDTTYICEVKK